MRRHLIADLGGVAALAAVAGCAAQHGPPPITDFGWFYAENQGEGAKLVYGQDGTDNVTLMLICRPRSGRIEVTLPGDGPSTVRLVSGRTITRIAVRPPKGEGMDNMLIGEPKADDPVLAAFVDHGELAIVDGGHRTPLPVRPVESRLARAFLAACRAA